MKFDVATFEPFRNFQALARRINSIDGRLGVAVAKQAFGHADTTPEIQDCGRRRGPHARELPGKEVEAKRDEELERLTGDRHGIALDDRNVAPGVLVEVRARRGRAIACRPFDHPTRRVPVVPPCAVSSVTCGHGRAEPYLSRLVPQMRSGNGPRQSARREGRTARICATEVKGSRPLLPLFVALPSPMALRWPLIDLRAPAASPITTERAQYTARTLARAAQYAMALFVPGWVFWRLARELMINAKSIGYDEQYFMWGGWSILKGLAPYRDFLEFKPPMTFLSHALALKLFGYQGEHFRYFFLGLSLAAVIAFVGSLLKRGADTIVCMSLGLAIAHLFTENHDSFLDDTESIGLSYYLLGVAALIARTRNRKTVEVVGGIFLSCAALSKEPFIPCVLATWAASYFLAYGSFSRDGLSHYVKYTTIGVGSVVVALGIYMVPTGAMASYVETIHSYIRMFRDPHAGYCVVLGMFKPTGRLLDDLPLQWERISKDFVNVATLGFVAPLLLASLLLLPRRSWPLFLTASLALASALYGVTLSHCYFAHYYIMAYSGLFFFLGAGVDAVSTPLALANGTTRLWLRAIVLLTVVLPLWPRVHKDLPSEVVGPWAPREPASGLFDFIRTHSAPNEKIFTTGPPGLYVYSDRLAAVRESSIIDEIIPSLPGNTDAERLRPLYEELVRNQPKIVFLDPERSNRKVRHLAAAIMPFLKAYRYTEVDESLYVKP